VRREDLEHLLVLLIELVDAELGQDDDTQNDLAVGDGNSEDGLVDRLSTLDVHGVRITIRVRRAVRPPGLRDVTGDPPPDLRHQGLVRLALVFEQLASKGHRQQRLRVGSEDVHPAVVVVDDGVKLGGDGLADLRHLVQAVQPSPQAVEHPQLGYGA
jgi:hypothetical protein